MYEIAAQAQAAEIGAGGLREEVVALLGGELTAGSQNHPEAGLRPCF